ncbi:MAG: HK97 gp10 family phage protein [Acidobacteriota bacterium]
MDNEQTFLALERFQSMLKTRYQQAMDQYLAAVIKEARSRHPYKDRTGALTRSIRRGGMGWHGNKLRGEVTTGVPYAEHVEAGTRPHPIVARKGRVLHFVVEGRDVFTPRVSHPGSKPYPFLGPAILRMERELFRLFNAAFDEAKRAAGLV